MIKILFLTANPKDAEPLNINTEVESVKKSICESDQSSIFDVVLEDHVNAADLHRHLFKYKPRIVHFSGHGRRTGDPIFVDENDKAATVSRQALLDLFGTINQNDRLVQCVVLNACWSDELASGLAKFVPCVVGMTKAITDWAAIAFATGFYRGIGFGWNVQAAFDFGKEQIRLLAKDRVRDDDWNLPKARAHDAYELTKFVIRDQQPIRTQTVLHNKYYLKETAGLGLISRTDIAVDLELERRVVIKSLIEPAGRAAFEQEVHELAKVSKHPNIVTVYGAWLREETPHYVREYVDGWSLRSQLDRDGRADLPIDFVHQVLASLGDAMLFAARAGVTDLGIEPEKVLIQKRESELGAASRYHIVVCPGAGGSDYIRSVLPSRLGESSRVYVPPEYFSHNRLTSVNDQQANQYRLGVFGYEMLLGSTTFRQEAAKRSGTSAVWRKVSEVDPERRCPAFLSDAIEKMINPELRNRYSTLEDAVEAIAYRNLDVEVARESFYRIQNNTPIQYRRQFFFEFYKRLLRGPGIQEVFAKFPPLKDPPGPIWQQQFEALKEAVIFLLVFSLLREEKSKERTILSRIAETHSPSSPRNRRGQFNLMRVEHYDRFGEALIDTVLEFDKRGIEEYDLRRAWERAIRPGLDYLKACLSSRKTDSDLASAYGSETGVLDPTWGESVSVQPSGEAGGTGWQHISLDFAHDDWDELEAHFRTALASAIQNQTVTISFPSPNAAATQVLGLSLWLSIAEFAIEAVRSALLGWFNRKKKVVIRRKTLHGLRVLTLENDTHEQAVALLEDVLGAPPRSADVYSSTNPRHGKEGQQGKKQ